MIFRKSLWNSISQKTREGATKTHKFQHKGHLLPKGSWAAPDDTRKILILYTKFILGGQNPRKGPRRGNHPPREALLGEKPKQEGISGPGSGFHGMGRGFDPPGVYQIQEIFRLRYPDPLKATAQRISG